MDVTNGFQESITIGGVTKNLKNSLILHSSAASTKYTTLKKAGVAYVVPAGKKLVIYAAHLATLGLACEVSLGKATASVDNGSAPAGYAGLSIRGADIPDDVGIVPATAGSVAQVPIYAEIEAGKYPTHLGVTGSVMVAWLCEEVTV